MRALELKIPPPLVALITGALMWMISRAIPAENFAFPARLSFAAGFAILGVLTAVSGVLAFRRTKTTLNPMKPDKATSLVVFGVFHITRNPMYLGLLLWLTGWAIFLSNAAGFVFPPVFVLYMNRFQILPEERMLASLFGQQFVAYKSRVRRWL